MRTPTLKRPIIPPFSQQKKNFLQRHIQQMEKPNQSNTQNSKINHLHQVIPPKLLETPENNTKNKLHLIAPLMVQCHKYPTKVMDWMNKDTSDSSRGIGAYQ